LDVIGFGDEINGATIATFPLDKVYSQGFWGFLYLSFSWSRKD
jgi:hypothetical protein